MPALRRTMSGGVRVERKSRNWCEALRRNSRRLREPRRKPLDLPQDDATKYADEYLTKWDSNKDGIVSWEESPRILRDFGFFRIDRNNDRQITREELIQAGQNSSGQYQRRGGQ